MRIAILTDSSASPEALPKEDCYVLPLNIIDQNNQITYFDGELSDEEYVEKIRYNNLTTSQSALGDIITTIDNLLLRYDQIIYCGIFSKLSGIFNIMQNLANTTYLNKLFVVDSYGVSIVLERMLLIINNAIKDNKSISEIVNLITIAKNNYYSYIVLNDWRTLARSGRVGKIKTLIGDRLRISLILEGAHQELKLVSKKLRFSNALHEALRIIKTKIPTVKSIDVAVGYLNPEHINLVKTIISEYGLHINFFHKLSQSIMTHIGFNSVAICGWK